MTIIDEVTLLMFLFAAIATCSVMVSLMTISTDVIVPVKISGLVTDIIFSVYSVTILVS